MSLIGEPEYSYPRLQDVNVFGCWNLKGNVYTYYTVGDIAKAAVCVVLVFLLAMMAISIWVCYGG